MNNWIEVSLADVLQEKGYIRGPFGSALKRGDLLSVGIPVYEQQHAIYNIRDFRYFISDSKFETMKRFQVKPNDLIISCSGTVGKVSIIGANDPKGIISQALLLLRVNDKIINPLYLKYFFSSWEGYNALVSRSGGSVQANISRREVIESIPLRLPSLETQNRIVSVLSAIDDKVKNNIGINQNLEKQLEALFIREFANDIATASTDTCPKLGDLITVIDNRGKTPPLTNETFDYPIIDVGALTGDGRIIDFNNCTKFVDQTTYETWFRSGHPKAWDILISTVGSLAEMKIHLGSKGCMAQNVVALRSTSIKPLYLYQYLKLIRADLIAYNIGSVQPSIKVTHIVKHPIFVPESSKLNEFEETARTITNCLYANCIESESLKELRDILLPKLMSGEIDVSMIDN